MRKVIVLIILVTVIGFAAGQLTWTQVNTDGFGDAPNEISFSMTVYSGNLYVGIDNCMTGTEVWKYNGTTWTQVNADGFGDANNWGSPSMAVYNGNLYAGTDNCITGTEIWRAHLLRQISWIEQPRDTNKPMRSLASYRISQVQSLLEEVQKTCDKLKDEDDPLYSECCVNRLDEVTGYLEMAEKFYMGGNYIAANYWALKALDLLHEIQECCGK